MNDKKLYEKILGLTSPWYVRDVKMDISSRSLTIKVEHRGNARFRCPECNKYSGIHDHRSRHWRHLPTCQFRTIIEARVPRVNCSEHGVHQISVPWAEENFKRLSPETKVTVI